MRIRSRGIAHGLTLQFRAEYAAWLSAKTRCYNPNYHNYSEYGGRGIRMSDEWRNNFPQFLRDMGPRPDGCSLDRLDTNGPYSPKNCRWATNTEQLRNTRRNRLLTHDGVTLPASEWAERKQMQKTTLMQRLYKGWSVERALTERVGPPRR